MIYLLWTIVIVLSIITIMLSVSIFLIIKKATYLSKKEKNMVKFAIDMYIEYGDEIDIASIDQHEIVINELNKIKNKLDNEN